MAHVSDFTHGDRVCIRIENGRLLRVGTVDRDNAPPARWAVSCGTRSTTGRSGPGRMSGSG